MVDTMTVLGVAACAKLAGDRLVRDFVAYVYETRTTIPGPARKPFRHRRKKTRFSRSLKPSTSGLGPRPSSSRRSKKVSLMTDAELEAELENRRHRRAKERDLYSRAMRSEKLATLEAELTNLRREIGRIDPVSSKGTFRSGTRHSVRWESLPKNPPLMEMPSPIPLDTKVTDAPTALMKTPSPSLGQPPAPPPPPPAPPGANEDEPFTVDPEQRRREKEERQKRREAKKREREQAQKKLTLADIIRSAGPDPMKRLKPAGKKAADSEKEEYEKEKREREEREMRQEQERIEQERKTIENMGRRVSEQSTTKAKCSSGEDEAKDIKKDSISEPALAHGSTIKEAKGSPKSEKDSLRVLNATPPMSDDASGNPENSELDYRESADSVQTRKVKGACQKASLCDTEQQAQLEEPLKDSLLSSAMFEDQVCQSNKKNKTPTTSEDTLAKQDDKKDEEILKVQSGREVTQAEAENISPNSSTTQKAPRERPEGKAVEKVDESSNRPRVL